MNAHNGRLGDTKGCIFVHGLDEQGKGEPLGARDGPADGAEREARRGNTMVGEDLLRQCLVVGDEQPGGVAAGVGLAHELQVADHVLVVGSHAVELFQEHKRNVGLPFDDGVADGGEVFAHAEGAHVVAHLSQRGNDVEFGLPVGNLFVAETLDALRRDQVFMDEHEHPELLHVKARSDDGHRADSSSSAR
jgi:hypothetical protein